MDNIESLKTLFEKSPEGLAYVSLEGQILDANPAYCQMLGFELEDLRRLHYYDYTPPRWQSLEQQIIQQQVLTRGYSEEYEKEYIRRNGEIFPVRVQTFVEYDPNGQPKALWGVARDVTAQKRYEEQLLTEAHTDFLTGVMNRRYLMQRLEEEMARAQRYHSPLSLLLLDLDHFKDLNDDFGHLFGDRALSQFAKALTGLMRQGDLLGRYGGEEFLLLLPQTPLEGAVELAERIRHQVSKLLISDEQHCARLTASFGVVSFDPPEKVLSLMQRADRALYAAKQKGRNCVHMLE